MALIGSGRSGTTWAWTGSRTARVVAAALAAVLVAALGMVGVAQAAVAGAIESISGGGTVYLKKGSATESARAAVINLRLNSASGGGLLQTYCIDLGTSTSTGTTYEEGIWADAGKAPGSTFQANKNQIHWILDNSVPQQPLAGLAGKPADLTYDEAVMATQAAIWKLSDGWDLNPAEYEAGDGAGRVRIKAYYDYLLTEAAKHPNYGNEPAPVVSVTPETADGLAGDKAGPFTIELTNAPNAALTLKNAPAGATIVNEAGTQVTLATDGQKVFIKVPTGVAFGSATIVATATGGLSAGRVFQHLPANADGSPSKQELISANRTTVTATAEGTSTWGSLEVTKSVDWNSVTPVPNQQFEICIKGPSFPDGNGDCRAFTYGGTLTQTWTGLKPGKYTVTEKSASPGQLSYWTTTGTPTEMTVSATAGPQQATVSNKRDTGSLVIKKTLAGGPAGYEGPFTLVYECTDGTKGDVSLLAGAESAAIGPMATGTTCTVSEPTLPDAPEGYSFGEPSFEPSETVTITSNPATVKVTAENTLTRDTGSVSVVKTLSNEDGAVVPESFTGTLTCELGEVATDYPVEFGVGQPASVSGIPTGSVCSVVEDALEPVDGFTWGAPVVSPESVTVAVEGGPFRLSVANTITRDTGSVSVVKTLSNEDGAVVPESFTGTLTCELGEVATDYPVEFGVGQPASVSGIPTGSVCSVVEDALEPVDGFTWGAPVVSPESVTVAAEGGPFRLSVANTITRDTGSVSVVKTLSNEDGAVVPESFTGTLTCELGEVATDYPVEFGVGQPASVSGIPTGSVCSVVEDALEPVDGFTWGAPVVSPESVTVAAEGGPFELKVANTITRDRGQLELRKVWIGPPGQTTLNIGTESSGSDVASQLTGENGAEPLTTGTVTVDTGTYFVSETGGLENYEASLFCFNDNGDGDGATADDGIRNGDEPEVTVGEGTSVAVARGADVVCTYTNARQAIPTLDKFANPVEGTTVLPSQKITYSVKVSNGGGLPTAKGDVVDTLPAGVTVTESTISDGGTYDAATRTITWKDVELAADQTRTFTFDVTVDPNVPAQATLVNNATWLELKDSTTHTTPGEGLGISKVVDPANGTTVAVGATLRYTMTVAAIGTMAQPNVVVRDYLPGRDPARPSSVPTTYVDGSAACEVDLAGRTCTASYDAATGRISWGLGTMTPGDAATATRTVTFAVVVGTPAAGQVQVLNGATVASDRTPEKPSNVVANPLPVVVVVPENPDNPNVVVPDEPDTVVIEEDSDTPTVIVEDSNPGNPVVVTETTTTSAGSLPRTGAGLPVGTLVGVAVGFLLAGSALLVVTLRRRRES